MPQYWHCVTVEALARSHPGAWHCWQRAHEGRLARSNARNRRHPQFCPLVLPPLHLAPALRWGARSHAIEMFGGPCRTRARIAGMKRAGNLGVAAGVYFVMCCLQCRARCMQQLAYHVHDTLAPSSGHPHATAPLRERDCAPRAGGRWVLVQCPFVQSLLTVSD